MGKQINRNKERAVHQTAASARRFRVGIRMPDWTIGFATRLFEGLADHQRRHGVFELHFDQPSGGDLPPAPVDESWEGDGLLVFRHTAEEARAWKRRGIQVVNLSSEFPASGPRFPQVTVDNEEVGRMAAGHLLSLGLRDFAFVEEPARRYSAERLAGFQEGIATVDSRLTLIEVPASSFPASSRASRIARILESALARLPKPCGIFCKDDIAAVLALRALSAVGRSCPDDVAVLGFSDDLVFCHMTTPGLSSIPFPGREIGLAGADLLHRMLSGESVPKEHRVRIAPLPLACRDSTGQVLLDDAVVTSALRLIREHAATGPYAVEDLAKQVGVSRELLRQRFHQTIGRSPKQEVDRVRMRALCDGLRFDYTSLDKLAENLGFPGSDELCRFFRRRQGMTPGEYRRHWTGSGV